MRRKRDQQRIVRAMNGREHQQQQRRQQQRQGSIVILGRVEGYDESPRRCVLSAGIRSDAQGTAFKSFMQGSVAFLLAATLVLVVVVDVRPADMQSLDDNDPVSSPAASSSSSSSDAHTPDQQGPSLNLSGSNASSSSSSPQLRLKPINFTLVDEIFQSALAEDEVARRWRTMDSQLQEGMKAILKMIFPQIVSISQDAKVSGDCSGGILKWILSLRNLRSWAIKMLDATGKPTAGIFEGSLSMLGNYRQCLSIRAPDEDEIEITDQFEEYFRGQFCVLQMKPWMPVRRPYYHLNESLEFLLRKNYKYYEKTLYDELAEIAVAFNFVNIRMDLCVPSTCSVADIQRVAELLGKTLEMRAKVVRCDTASRDTTSHLWQRLDQTTYIWLALPIALISLSLVSTLLVKLGFKSRASRGLRRSHFCPSSLPSASTTANQHQQQQQQQQLDNCNSDSNKRGKVFALFQSLSFGADSKPTIECQSVAASQQEHEEFVLAAMIRPPKTLYGLRNIFIIWFIIVQMTVELKYQYLRESLQLRNMILTYWPFQIIINSTLLFEALIVISAFIYSYTCIEYNLKSLTTYLVDKYISLVLPTIALIALTIMTPILAIETPVWFNFVQDQADTCKSTGYVNLFFLQNFIGYDKICLPHTWLFCVELQLFVLVIPLMLDLRRNFASLEQSIQTECETLGSTNAKGQRRSLFRTIIGNLIRSNLGLLALLLIVIGYCVNFILVYSNQLPPSWFYSFPDTEQKSQYFGGYLTKTWTHLSSFLVGLLAGHVSRSHLQLRGNRLDIFTASETQQSSALGCSLNQSPQLSHGSTSTITLTTTDRSQANLQITSIRPGRRHWGLLVTASALLMMMLIIVSTFSWSTSVSPSPLVAGLYDASSRLIWSLALSAIMFGLCNNRRHAAGLIERALEHPLSVRMGNLAPIAYLVAPYVNNFVLAVEEQALFPSMFIMFHIILGNIVIIYAMSLILATVIERPARRLVSQV